MPVVGCRVSDLPELGSAIDKSEHRWSFRKRAGREANCQANLLCASQRLGASREPGHSRGIEDGNLSSPTATETSAFLQDKRHKVRTSQQIATPQAPGLLGEPKEPFKTHTRHPAGWLADHASQVIERGSHSDAHRHREPMEVPRDPLLLLRTSKANQDDIRPGGIDCVNDPR